jgi:hypothetical protein
MQPHKKPYSPWHLGFCLWLLCSGCFTVPAAAQNQRNNDYKPLSCQFLHKEHTVASGEAISNVLYVKNLNGITREFYLEVTTPNGWRSMVSPKRIYALAPDDSMFIPVRIIPNLALMKGGTKYNINVFVVGTDGRAHAACSFFASKPKKTDWDMAVLPRSRIYFLNNETSAPLSIFVGNRGDDVQELNLSWRIMGQGLNLETDGVKNKTFLDLKMAEGADTVIDFVADIHKPNLNFRRIDAENYRPKSVYESRKYSIYFKAAEPFVRSGGGTKSSSTTANLIKLNSAVDFIKLSNTTTLSNYGSGVIPVIWNSNLVNILGVQPMWGNNLMVRFAPRPNSMLFANINHFFTYYSPSRETLYNFQGMLGYFTKKYDVILGQGAGQRDPLLMGAGMGNTAGQGIGVAVRPIEGLNVSAFYNQGPQLFTANPAQSSFGVGASYKASQRLKFGAGVRQTNFFNQLAREQIAVAGLNYRFLRNHNIMARVGFVLRTDSVNTPAQFQRQGLNALAGYTGNFFRNKLTYALRGMYNNRFFPNNGLIEMLAANQMIGINLSKLNIRLGTGFMQSTSTVNGQQFRIIQVPSNLSIRPARARNQFLIPNLYHNYIADSAARMHQAGLNFNASVFNYEKNIRAALNLMGGYNFYRDSVVRDPLFNLNAFVMFGYRNMSANIRYVYGHINFQGVRGFYTNPTRFPQFVFSTISKQHVFAKMPNFVGELQLNHSWNNITYSHNLGLSPNIYFFTNNGWRFNLLAFFNLNARNPEKAQQFYAYQGTGIPLPEAEPGTQFASNMNFQLGVRKEFGILLPKKMRRTFYTDATFVAFLDFNGNRIMDNDEVPLENMVVQLNGHEAITNSEGKVQFLHVQHKRYFHNVIPLVDMGGWFGLRTDSIDITPQSTYYIPFTRGVKIMGSVLLDREKFSADVVAELDLSNIKIFTTDTSGNTFATMTDRAGNFEFYVPFGYYALSMDEEVLSDRFILAQNNIPLELEEGMESYYQAFFIIEKRRKIKKKKFNEKGEVVIVEEIEELDGRETGVVNPNNTNEGTIFRDERRNRPVKDSTNINKINYDELDKRIERLDSLIEDIKNNRSVNVNNNINNQAFNKQVMVQALKELKEEEERNTPYYIVVVGTTPEGAAVPSNISAMVNYGSVISSTYANKTYYHLKQKNTSQSKAFELFTYARTNKIGNPEVYVMYKGEILTVAEYNQKK